MSNVKPVSSTSSSGGSGTAPVQLLRLPRSFSRWSSQPPGMLILGRPGFGKQWSDWNSSWNAAHFAVWFRVEYPGLVPDDVADEFVFGLYSEAHLTAYEKHVMAMWELCLRYDDTGHGQLDCMAVRMRELRSWRPNTGPATPSNLRLLLGGDLHG